MQPIDEEHSKNTVYLRAEALRVSIEALIIPSKEKYTALAKIEEAKILIEKSDLTERPL